MPTLATPRMYAFHQRPPDSRWWSLGISAAVTAALFAASFAAMKSVAPWMQHAAPATAPALVRLAPPAVVAARPARRAPLAAPTKPRAAPLPPAALTPPAPTGLTQRVDTANAINAPSTAAVPSVPNVPGTADVPTASAKARSVGASTAPRASASHPGAPVAPVGVVGKRAPKLTSDQRAASLEASMNSLAEYVRTHPPTGDELANIQREKRQAERVEQRATTAGNARDVHVMTGDGKGGVGVASGAAGHISVPFLEPGPSPEQRKRDAALDSEYVARLHRLEARLDSLRRDSLARKSGVPTGAPLRGRS